jgi:hypothetical protein
MLLDSPIWTLARIRVPSRPWSICCTSRVGFVSYKAAIQSFPKFLFERHARLPSVNDDRSFDDIDRVHRFSRFATRGEGYFGDPFNRDPPAKATDDLN